MQKETAILLKKEDEPKLDSAKVYLDEAKFLEIESSLDEEGEKFEPGELILNQFGK